MDTAEGTRHRSRMDSIQLKKVQMDDMVSYAHQRLATTLLPPRLQAGLDHPLEEFYQVAETLVP